MNSIDNRVHQRVQCFNLPFEREFIPIWIFNSNDGVAGLVVNMSFSGIQLLTDATEPLAEPHYDIVFIEDADFEVTTAPCCHIEQVWNDKISAQYNTSGFIFTGKVEAVIKHQLEKFHHASKPFLRCELRAA